MHTMKHMESDEEARFMEKAYLAMKKSGTGSLVLGIIILVVGVTAGILSIVNGAVLLKNKKSITF